MSLKSYEFDNLLTSEDIKFIEREIVNKTYQEVRCDRCNALLTYINIIRIEMKYYNLGDFCYNSIKNILSEIRKKSLHFIRIDLEETYNNYLTKKFMTEKEGYENTETINKYDPDYNTYLSLKWDYENNSLPHHMRDKYNDLKDKFEKL